MSLFIASLNSGSNGNCYYIGNQHEAVLVDAGISCRETERRMNRLGLSISNVRAIFISHEHTDHIRGAEIISRKHQIPIYITEATHKNSRFKFNPEITETFISGFPIQIGNLQITPFLKSHDALDPHSFIISGNGVTTGVFTDIGTACQNLELYMSQCDAAFLESNYDESMLENGRYPVYLKKRIRGDKGHLSNDQALELFLKRRSSTLQLLILSHLSAENNHPNLVSELFNKHANGTQIFVASRYQESQLFFIST